MDVSDLEDGEEVLVAPRGEGQPQTPSQIGLAQAGGLAGRGYNSPSSRAARRRPTPLRPPTDGYGGRAGSAVTLGELQLREFMGWGASANYSPDGRAAGASSSSPSNEARPNARSRSPSPASYNARRAWDASTTGKVVRPGVMMRPWQRRGGGGGSGSSAGGGATMSIWSPPPTAFSPSPPRLDSNRPATASSVAGRADSAVLVSEIAALARSNVVPGLEALAAHSRSSAQRSLSGHGNGTRSDTGGSATSGGSGRSSSGVGAGSGRSAEWALPDGRPSPRPRPYSSGEQQLPLNAAVETPAATAFACSAEEQVRARSAFGSGPGSEELANSRSTTAAHRPRSPALSPAALGQRGTALPVVGGCSTLPLLSHCTFLSNSTAHTSFRVSPLIRKSTPTRCLR
jgi:hypothetical protein